MARKVVDVSMLQGLVEGAEGQEIKKGNRRSIDPKFPVFTTPVNENILVYIPRTNVVTTENGQDMKVLSAYIHDYSIGKSFGSIRCINGLSGNPVFDALGYDGTCPACEAMEEVWELYRIKLNLAAKEIGVDPQDDPTNILKPTRDRILREMDLRGSEEYVTFPVVIIPTKGRLIPADDAIQNLKPVYVTWKKTRYEEKILGGLESLINNPGHPAGMFWSWNFTYNTGGKQANARDSAKNAKYAPMTDAQALQMYEPLRQACEEVAKEFTLLKAAEVIVANQFIYKDDYLKEVDKIMAKTRQMLEIAQATGGVGGQAQLNAGQPALGVPAGGNPLANFGVAPDQQAQPQAQLQPQAQTQPQPQMQPQMGVAQGQSAPQNMGVEGNPVRFGG